MTRHLVFLISFCLGILAIVGLEACGDEQEPSPSGTSISALVCSNTTFSTTLLGGQAVSLTATLPYTNGDGSTYPAGTPIASTGGTGLSATLVAGRLAVGAGQLTYRISGTPLTGGTAIFPIEFGGTSCLLTLPVAFPPASVSALSCSSVTVSTTVITTTSVSGTGSASTVVSTSSLSGTFVVPYTGGNGSPYSSTDSFTSTGVTGLTATLQSGTLALGPGSLTYTFTGVPSSTTGTARFVIVFSGQSCTISFPTRGGRRSARAVTQPHAVHWLKKAFGATPFGRILVSWSTNSHVPCLTQPHRPIPSGKPSNRLANCRATAWDARWPMILPCPTPASVANTPA